MAIDILSKHLTTCGWIIHSTKQINLHAAMGKVYCLLYSLAF
ncbi:MAG TPA: hypothetical protein VFQ86_00875 [Arachidicoccus soli]|nr:hypothetical protein [Arachidicoccus soli]